MEKHLQSLANIHISAHQKEEDYHEIRKRSARFQVLYWKPVVISIAFLIIGALIFQIGQESVPQKQAAVDNLSLSTVESVLFNRFGDSVEGKTKWHPFMKEVTAPEYLTKLNEVIAMSWWEKVPSHLEVSSEEFILRFDSGEQRIFYVTYDENTRVEYLVDKHTGNSLIYMNETKDDALQSVMFQIQLSSDMRARLILILSSLAVCGLGMLLNARYKRKYNLDTTVQPISSIAQGLVNMGGIIALSIIIFVFNQPNMFILIGAWLLLMMISVQLQTKDEHIRQRTVQVMLYNFAACLQVIANVYM